MAVPFVELARDGSRVDYLPFPLFTLVDLPEHFHSHIGFILMLEIFNATYILLSICLYGWSNSNVSLIHLTIRIISGVHLILRGWKGDTGDLNYRRNLNLREDLIWKGDLRHFFIPWLINSHDIRSEIWQWSLRTVTGIWIIFCLRWHFFS